MIISTPFVRGYLTDEQLQGVALSELNTLASPLFHKHLPLLTMPLNVVEEARTNRAVSVKPFLVFDNDHDWWFIL